MPDFLVIGAQRSGTTWLHHVLRQHPQLWLPPIKELHYFDRPRLRRGWHRPSEWPLMLLGAARSRDLWALRYGFGLRSDAWYTRLFEQAQAKGLITGEVAPAYATLGDDVFERIDRLNPAMRLVFIMRDPVDRAWSAVARRQKSGRIAGRLTSQGALEIVRSAGMARRAHYTNTIRRLEKIFRARQLHYCFFDDLCQRPTLFVKEIIDFLGADPNKLPIVNMSRKVNAAATCNPIPAEFEREMARQYLPIVTELSDRFEGPPRAWRSRYEKLLAPTLVQPHE